MEPTTEQSEDGPEGRDDGGFLSRKLLLTLFSMLLATVFGLMSAKWPTLGSALPTVCTALVTMLGLYLTGNVVGKITGK